MLIASKLYAEKPAERRVFGRVAADIRARLGGKNNGPQSVVVRNVSKGGFMVEDWIGLETGQRVDIEMPPLARMRATVVWTVGKQAGCEFWEPLNERQFDVVLDAHAPPVVHEAPVFGRKGQC
jgi:hypothetical protein